MTDMITLSLHPNKVFTNVARHADDAMLGRMLESFTKLIAGKTLQFSDDSDPALCLLAKRATESSLSREEKVELLGALVKNLANAINIAQASAPRYLDLYGELLNGDNKKMSTDEVAKIIGTRPVFDIYDEGWNAKFLTEILLYPICRKAKESATFAIPPKQVPDKVVFSLRFSSWRDLVFDAIVSSRISPPALPGLQEGAKIIGFEERMADDIDLMLPLLVGKKFLTPSGDLSEAKCRKEAAKSGVKQFGVKLNAINDRPALLADALGSYYHTLKAGSEVTYKNFLKYLRKYLDQPGEPGHTILMLMPDIAGITYVYKDHNNSRRIVQELRKYLAQAGDGWVDISRIFERLQQLYVREFGEKLNLFDIHRWDSTPLKYKPDKTEITDENIDTYVNRPFVESVLAVLWAVGIIEFAFVNSVGALSTAPMRLTPAGKFYLGITNEIEVAETTVDDLFDFDDDNLIVTAYKPDSPYCDILKKAARPISPNRFIISAKTIVSGAKNADEVKTRIAAIQRICPSPGSRLVKEFNDSELRAKCLQPAKKAYKLLHLNPHVPGLIRFIATNRELAPHIIKVENSHLLVEKDYMQTFTEILHREGYIL